MKTVAKLQVKAQEVNKLAKSNASNEALKKAITETHDIFHEIIGMCTKETH
jgi:ubiquinone biosynthesis protein Coq4